MKNIIAKNYTEAAKVNSKWNQFCQELEIQKEKMKIKHNPKIDLMSAQDAAATKFQLACPTISKHKIYDLGGGNAFGK